MAGYVPESTKEVQALIVKSYADTVLNAFLTAPELVAVAPVGSRADYETQLSMLAEQEEKTRQERRNFVSLCEAALTEGELMLRYVRNRRLEDSDVRWLEEKVSVLEARVQVTGSKTDEYVLQGLKDLLSDVRAGRFTVRAEAKKREVREGRFVFGGYEQKLHPKSPLKSYLEFMYSIPEGFDPGDVADLQRRNCEISQLADVARYGYDILNRLCRKAKALDVPSVFVSVVMPSGYRKKAERLFNEGKTPKPMNKPIVLSGPPGVGKTAMLRDVANWTGTNLFSFSMAQMDAASFGFPVYDSITGSAKRDILDDMKNTVKKPGVVLLDEMNRTGTDIQSKLLTYLLDHKVSGFTVHPLSLVVGAENPVSADPYGTMTKSIAMIDRCMYIDMSNYEMIVSGWLKWLDEEYGELAEENELLRYFIKFLKEDPPMGARDIILKIPEDPEENPGFPTPRSIDAAISAIVLSHGDYDTAMTEISANVGTEMANRFGAYMEIIRALPSPQEIANKADEIPSLFAAIAVDADIMLKKDDVSVVGFEKGLFNQINGYDDGKRPGDRKVIDLLVSRNKDPEFKEMVEKLTPEIAKKHIEKYVRDLYFSGSRNVLEVGAEAELADSLLYAFRKSYKDSIENGKPIDGVFLNNLFKAACFFPVPTTRNNLLNMMERTILLSPWTESYADLMQLLARLRTSEIKTRSGTVKLNADTSVKAFNAVVPAAPWLIKVSKRFNDSFTEVSQMLKDIMSKENKDEIDVV